MRRSIATNLLASALGLLFCVSAAFADHTSTGFKGPKANTGTVMHSVVDGKNVLTLSDDFVAPKTPDPHWQVVDKTGNVYLLNRLMIKGLTKPEDERYNKTITLPAYIKDVAAVQMWCAWAETVLGEAKFETAMTARKN